MDTLYTEEYCRELFHGFDQGFCTIEVLFDENDRASDYTGHPTVAFSYHNLGRVLVAQGQLTAAVPLYEEGVRIRETSLGTDNPFTAALVESLAIVRIRLGNLEEGLRLLERALAAYQRAYGADHQETLESHHNLVIALAMASRYEEAIVHLREVVLRDVNGRFRMDLNDKLFDPFRSLPAFRRLVGEAGRRPGAPQLSSGK